jgi:uncharacterized membrane protein required for colicin V production
MSEFFTPNRILDIAIALIVILTVIRYLRSGFIAGMLDFFGTLLSVGGAVWGAKKVAPILFEKLFRDNLVSRTEYALESSEGVLTIDELLNKISGFLPRNVIDTFFGEGAVGTFDLSVPDIAQTIVTDVVQPLVMPVLTILLFFMIFIVCRIVIGFIVTALKNINRIPILGTANRVLGAASGLLVGLLYGYLIVCAVWTLVVITGGDISFLQEEMLQNSFFYGIFSGIIPFK